MVYRSTMLTKTKDAMPLLGLGLQLEVPVGTLYEAQAQTSRRAGRASVRLALN